MVIKFEVMVRKYKKKGAKLTNDIKSLSISCLVNGGTLHAKK